MAYVDMNYCNKKNLKVFEYYHFHQNKSGIREEINEPFYNLLQHLNDLSTIIPKMMPHSHATCRKTIGISGI